MDRSKIQKSENFDKFTDFENYIFPQISHKNAFFLQILDLKLIFKKYFI